MESRRFFFLAHIPMELSFTTSNFRRRILDKPELTASLPLKIGRGPQKERRKSSNHQSSVAFAVSFREGIHESVMPWTLNKTKRIKIIQNLCFESWVFFCLPGSCTSKKTRCYGPHHSMRAGWGQNSWKKPVLVFFGNPCQKHRSESRWPATPKRWISFRGHDKPRHPWEFCAIYFPVLPCRGFILGTSWDYVLTSVSSFASPGTVSGETCCMPWA